MSEDKVKHVKLRLSEEESNVIKTSQKLTNQAIVTKAIMQAVKIYPCHIQEIKRLEDDLRTAQRKLGEAQATIKAFQSAIASIQKFK
ncbi:MAG: hypothetical protein LBV47_01180 [Bacteroidales bacterium]|jgi:hypothetical protein|nr:hypothetical protein [Bacteroidales bacterium]